MYEQFSLGFPAWKPCDSPILAPSCLHEGFVELEGTESVKGYYWSKQRSYAQLEQLARAAALLRRGRVCRNILGFHRGRSWQSFRVPSRVFNRDATCRRRGGQVAICAEAIAIPASNLSPRSKELAAVSFSSLIHLNPSEGFFNRTWALYLWQVFLLLVM